MKKKVVRKGEGPSLIGVIGDEDTVTGFLLTGIGERNIKGDTNFLVVDNSINDILIQNSLETPVKLIEDTFKRFIKSNLSVILINQNVSLLYGTELE